MGSAFSSPFLSNPSAFATASSSPAPDLSKESNNWRTYDFVIVGGGSAGCVLASRLSEDANTTVLLIEAGRSHKGDIPTSIPLAFPNIFRTERDWNLYTTPQKQLNDRETYWPRGKILGGTSATNALIYHRCPPQDFDEWVSLGATGWSYTDLEPYFDKAEKYHPSPNHPSVDPTGHGSDGPWFTGHPSETAPITHTIIEACQTLGMKYIDDISAKQGSLGVSRFIGFLDSKGRRISTATAYLTDDVMKRPNLTVAVNVMVERVLFSNATVGKPRAIGVEISTSPTSQKYCVAATREVILSGGAVGSPQILLLSGVGPAEDLAKLQIPVVKDLRAVGQNVIDHISTGPLAFRAKPHGLTYDYLNSPLSGVLAMAKWFALGSGPLSSLGWSSAGFVRSTDPSVPYYAEGEAGAAVNDNTSAPGTPDIELIWFPLTVFSDEFPKAPAGTTGITLSAVSLKPESRGSITIQSRSPWDKPVIDPNYLSTESDMNVLVRGVRILMRIARTEPLASKLALMEHSTDSSTPWWPGDADPDKISDGELREMLHRSALPAWHPVSSARIGASETNSVVDAELRVHGITGLRVVDASVFPTQLSGHPCAVVVAMAEKAADMIRRG